MAELANQDSINAKQQPTSATTSHAKRQARYYTTLLVPTLILLTLITLLPVIFLIVTGFTSWDLSRPGSLEYVGLKNYIRIFTNDRRFWNSVWVQVRLTLMTVPTQVILGLTLALFLKARVKNSFLMELSRGVFIVPMVIPPIIAGLIWKILFTPPVSILNWLSVSLGLGELAWLGHPQLALVAIAIATIWEFFPFCFLLLYAGLLSLPEEPFEAAQVDGASYWQAFKSITLPLLMPTLNIVLLFRLIDSIRSFPVIYVMTQGGPGFATEPTNYYAYNQAFGFSYIGYSSSLIMVMLIFTMLLTFAVLRSTAWQRGAKS